MLRFIFRELLWGGIVLAAKVALWVGRFTLLPVARAHAVFFRNLFASKVGAAGDPFAHLNPTRRDA